MSGAAQWQDYTTPPSKDAEWQDFTPAAHAKTVAPPPGFLQRAGEAVGAPTTMKDLKAAQPTLTDAIGGPAVTMGKAAVGYGKNLYAEGKKAFTDAKQAGADYAGGGVTLGQTAGRLGADTSDLFLKGVAGPIGSGGVASFGEDVAAKNWKGAAGDAVGTLVNALLLRGKPKATTEARVSKLGFAAGGAEAGIEHALPELDKTLGGGVPETLGELHTAVKDTGARLEQRFNTAIARTRGVSVVPVDISAALDAKAGEMPPTAEGQAIAQQLRAASTEYQRPWSLGDLNKERIYRNGLTRGLESKSGSAQMAAMRSNVDTMVDKIVADESRNVLYDELGKRFPDQNFRADKLTQSHLIDVRDQLDAREAQLRHSESMHSGPSPLDRVRVSASLHPGGIGVTPRIHPGELLAKSPTKSVNKAVRGAFVDTTTKNATRRGLAAAGARGRTVSPPPGDDQDDQ